MKIYTKTGDSGETSLIDGSRVLKNHIRIEAVGAIDELNSYIGLLRSQEIEDDVKNFLIDIQRNLISIMSVIVDKSVNSKKYIFEETLILIEKKIDENSSGIENLKSFILPGGNTIVSYCHITRCICRRAERIMVSLKEYNYVDEMIIKYFNRLSDYFFILSQKLSKDFGLEEIKF